MPAAGPPDRPPWGPAERGTSNSWISAYATCPPRRRSKRIGRYFSPHQKPKRCVVYLRTSCHRVNIARPPSSTTTTQPSGCVQVAIARATAARSASVLRGAVVFGVLIKCLERCTRDAPLPLVFLTTTGRRTRRNASRCKRRSPPRLLLLSAKPSLRSRVRGQPQPTLPLKQEGKVSARRPHATSARRQPPRRSCWCARAALTRAIAVWRASAAPGLCICRLGQLPF